MRPDIYLLAIILGAFCTLGFAPFDITILFIVGFAFVYIILCQTLKKNQAFFLGLWFGFAHFSTSFYWFGIALATDLARFWWVIPIAVFGLSLFFSLYFAFSFLLFKLFRYQNPFTFALIVCFFEFLLLLIQDKIDAKSLYIAIFYQKHGQYHAAISRFLKILNQSKNHKYKQEAMFRLAQSYKAIGLEKEAKRYFLKLKKNNSGWVKLI